MNQERIKKLESLSRSLLSNFIIEEVDNPEDFGIITVTGVKISSDLSYLDVYVSCLKNIELLTKTLAKNNTQIQRKLHKSIAIRKLPRVRYRYDEKGEVGQNVCDAINNLNM